MIDDKVMAKLAKLLSLSPGETQDLGTRLGSLAQRVRKILDETPSNFERGPPDVSLTQRTRWLDTNAIRPAQRLVEALNSGAMFATYPEDYASKPTAHDVDDLRARLAQFLKFATDLRDDLAQQMRDKSNHNTELRAEIIFWITAELEQSGAVVERREFVGGIGDPSAIAEAVRIVSREVTGQDIAIDHHLKDLVRMRSGTAE